MNAGDAMAPVFLVARLAIAIYGLFNRGPYYNDVEMPITSEEIDDRRPATEAQSVIYVACGILVAAWGLYGSGKIL